MSDLSPGDAKTVADVEKTPDGVVRRWIAEIDLADKAESDWRTEGKEIWERYENGKTHQDTFNILWSNTETLAPAIYNSRPEPDVRRRFRDADTVAKYASMVLERALAYTIDTDDFDETIKDAVLDMLIPGRAVVRIKYEPKFQSMADPQTSDATQTGDTGAAPPPDSAGQPSSYPAQSQPAAGDGSSPASPLTGDAEGAAHEQQQYEVITDESAPVAHVQWDDFRHGPGKRWADVCWIAFRHANMNYDDLVKSFGEAAAKKIPLNDTDYSGDASSPSDSDLKPFFKTAEVWEIWDKDQKRVLFISKGLKSGPIKEIPDPLELQDFFPLPRPLEAIRNSRSLIPTPTFRLYKSQALELETVSRRINKAVVALKARGVYDKRMEEAEKLLEAGDNEMIPISNGAAFAQAGLDKAFWLMPIDKLVAVVEGLYEAREQIKQTIYEITGISDIIRGSTVASETATAQSIKSKWGTIRLQRLQSEVARFVKDLMRLMADLIAHRFTQQTLAKMTGVQLPMQAQKDQIQAAMQQQAVSAQAAAMQAQQAGQPPPPPPQPDPKAMQLLALPSWEDVLGLLRSDALRTCKVDVETDSTVAEMIDSDMEGMTQVITLIGQVIAGAVPAVQGGMLTVEQIRDICVAIARRARLGSVFEDALEEMKPPAPPPPPPPPPGAAQAAQALGEVHGMVADLHNRVTGQPLRKPVGPSPTSTPQLPSPPPQGIQ